MTPSATALVSSSVTATATAHPSLLNSLAKTFQRIVSAGHLKNAKLAWAHPAHVQVSGKNGGHVTACVDPDTVSESSQTHALSTPTATQHHHKLKLNRAASPKFANPVNGQSGPPVMQSATHSGKCSKSNSRRPSITLYELKASYPVAVLTQSNFSQTKRERPCNCPEGVDADDEECGCDDTTECVTCKGPPCSCIGKFEKSSNGKLNFPTKGAWSEWTPCDGECGGGVRTRERDDPCIPDFVPEVETEECEKISKSDLPDLTRTVQDVECVVVPAKINPKVVRAKIKETRKSISSILDKFW